MELQEPLNRAHRIQRQAERDILSGRFSDAVNSFEKAAESYGDAVNELGFTESSKSSLALQILLEQKKFCLHQVEILLLKLKQLETYSKQNIMDSSHFLSNLDVEQRNVDQKTKRDDINNYLKSTIFRKLDEHDTLLGQLNVSSKDGKEENVAKFKLPKSDSVIIEELRQCNVELRGFIVSLLEELDRKAKEIEMLKSERERRSPSSLPSVINGNDVDGDLPELAPLELPDYMSGELEK